MTISLMLRWWYSAGFAWVWRGMIVRRLNYVSQVFSVKEMITTLFAPFRQTYSGKASGVGLLQAFADRTVSRVIGFVVRTLLLIVALIAALVAVAIGVVLCLTWPILPALPLASIILAVLKVGL